MGAYREKCIDNSKSNQTMALSGSEKIANQGYVNLTHNFKVVLDFTSKSCKKIICRKLNVVSKLLGLI